MVLERRVRKRTMKHVKGHSEIKPRQRSLLQAHAGTMQRVVQRGVLAGTASTAIYKGETIYRRSFGYSDLETGARFNHDTICRIYCSTKPYINMMTMILVEQGNLSLKDPVSKYIPAMKNIKVNRPGTCKSQTSLAQQTMFVYHLLTHSAGFGYGIDFNFPAEDDQVRYTHIVEGVEHGHIKSLEEFANALAKVPLLFEPGERYEYSYSTDVLGRVLEVAANMTLDALLQEKLFAPLGMVDTGFSVPRSNLERLAAIYGNADTWGHLHYESPSAVPIATRSGLVRIDGLAPEDSAWAQGNVRVHSGGGLLGYNRGGLVSTAKDTEAFVKMIIAGGVCPNGTRLLSRKALRQMERNLLVGHLRKPSGSRWCLLGDMPHGPHAFQQGGAAGNYWHIDRKREIAIVVFMQQVDGESWEDVGFRSDIADLDRVMRDFVGTV